MSYKDSVYIIVIALMCWPKCMNFGAETHLGGGGMSALVFLQPPLLDLPASLAVQPSIRKGPWRFWLHCYDCHRAVMLMCQNSHWWRTCEHCFFVSWPWLLTQFEQHGRHMSCALIGTRCRLSHVRGRVRLATKSAVATCYTPGIWKIVAHNVTPLIGGKFCHINN